MSTKVHRSQMAISAAAYSGRLYESGLVITNLEALAGQVQEVWGLAVCVTTCSIGGKILIPVTQTSENQGWSTCSHCLLISQMLQEALRMWYIC